MDQSVDLFAVRECVNAGLPVIEPALLIGRAARQFATELVKPAPIDIHQVKAPTVICEPMCEGRPDPSGGTRNHGKRCSVGHRPVLSPFSRKRPGRL